MMSLVLQNLEKLHADLVAVDPANATDAVGTVADMAVALRDLLAGTGFSSAASKAMWAFGNA